MNDKDKQKAIDDLKKRLEGGSNPRQPRSIYNIIWECNQFLNWVESPVPTPEDAETWISRIKKKRKSIGYQNSAYWAIKRLYLVNKWDWPESLETGPRAAEMYEQNAPFFSIDDIERLVFWASANAEPQEAAMIAVSTTWGLRREEMRRIQPDDIKDDTLLVRTGKHGRARWHLIPEEIQPYIEEYSFEPRLSLAYVSNLFIIVCMKANISRPDGTGWHAIRRTLAGFFEDQRWQESKIYNYMRWSTSRRGMAMRYASATREDKETDLEAYSMIPWLKSWVI